MNIPPGIVLEQDIESTRRVGGGGRFNGVKDEALVVFQSAAIRDTVCSYARNLGGWIDNKNNPTAGIRLEIPDHLYGMHKDLKIYGSILRTEHGQGLKRHIKYEDTTQALCMDVKLPDTEDWLRVDWAMAKEARAEKERTAAATTRRRLISSTSSNETLETERGGSSTPVVPTSTTLSKFARPRTGWGDSGR